MTTVSEHLGELVERGIAGVGLALVNDWRGSITEFELSGFFDRVDPADAPRVAEAIYFDLARNPDGSWFLRARAQVLRERSVAGGFVDPLEVALAWEAVADLVHAEAPEGLDR